MKILIGCEYSGVVRDACLRKGFDAVSCDVLPTESPGPHIQGDIFEAIDSDNWDFMIGHPPCQYLALSGVWCLHQPDRFPNRWNDMYKAAVFFWDLLHADIEHIALENSVMHGYATTVIGTKHNQTFQPYDFGADASKRTALWLKNLPEIVGTNKLVKKRYSNQTPSGRNNLPPSANRAKERARFHPEVADAMVDQWLVNRKKAYQVNMPF